MGPIRLWWIADSGYRIAKHPRFRHNRNAAEPFRWSPHHRDILASSGYDMTCRVWNRTRPAATMVHTDHSEFVMGLGWALFDPGLLGSCAWDEEVHLYRT